MLRDDATLTWYGLIVDDKKASARELAARVDRFVENSPYWSRRDRQRVINAAVRNLK